MSLQVEAGSIDDIVPKKEKIAFVKPDLEGGEYHALLAAKDTSKRSLPFIVLDAGHSSSTHYGITPAMSSSQLLTRIAVLGPIQLKPGMSPCVFSTDVAITKHLPTFFN